VFLNAIVGAAAFPQTKRKLRGSIVGTKIKQLANTASYKMCRFEWYTSWQRRQLSVSIPQKR
jgi:hypothetical protein